MRRVLAPVFALAAIVALANVAGAAEPEPPGAVLLSTDIGSSSSVSLSPGRVVWSGVADGGQVLLRSLSSDGTTVTAGPQSLVGVSGSPSWALTQGSSSGDRTLWSARTQGAQAVLVTTGEHFTKLLTHNGVAIRLSGNRALYRRSADGHFLVYDLATGRTLDVSERFGTRMGSGNNTVDLFGNDLVYITPNFSVRVKNLSNSSAPVLVAGGSTFNGARVTTYRNWTMWHRYLHFTDGVENVDECMLRDIRNPMAPATPISCNAVLTSAGAVFPSKGAGGTTTWSVQPYGATDAIALPVPGSTTQVVLNDNVMVWQDSDGLHAAPTTFPYRPQSLGNPGTNGAYRIGGANWAFRLVTTAKLTSCHVVVSREGLEVRDLPCDPSAMATGQVLVHWDGRNEHGNQVSPGTYRWSVGASNASGKMRRVDGSLHTTTGTMTVVR